VRYVLRPQWCSVPLDRIYAQGLLSALNKLKFRCMERKTTCGAVRGRYTGLKSAPCTVRTNQRVCLLVCSVDVPCEGYDAIVLLNRYILIRPFLLEQCRYNNIAVMYQPLFAGRD